MEIKNRRDRLINKLAIGLLVFSGVTVAMLFGAVIVQAIDGSGTNAVDPTSVVTGSSGNTETFTYTASETMDSGGITITVPSGWTAPQGTNGSAGYTTATSASGTIANVLNNLDSATGWTATYHMALSADTGDKQEGSASLLNTITSYAAANEQWYFNYGAASNWGASADGNLGVGMWLKSSANTAAGDFYWQNDDTASLASPNDTISLAALTANTWTYTSATLGATSRTSILSYGLRYTNDIGVVDLRADSISVLFNRCEANTGWSGDANISDSSISGAGNFKEGTAAVRCTYAGGAGTGTSGDCWNNEGSAITVGPGTTVSFWIRSSVALADGDFDWVDDNSTNLGSADSSVNIPALSANTWTYVTLTSGTSGDMRSFGLRQIVDKGALTIDIDAIGKQVDSANATTGWSTSSDTVQTLSADSGVKQEGTNSLKNVVNATATAGDKWYQTLGATQDWSGYTTVGFWIRSTVATTSGQLQFEYDDASDLSSPIGTLNIGALSANTWTYQKLALTGTRTSVNSYGIKYTTDIGAATIYLDDVLIGPGSPTFPGGGVINARFLQLTTGQTAIVTYGAGGGASGAAAPGSCETSTFTTQSRISDAGTLSSISSSPTVTVKGPVSEFTLNDPGDTTVGTRLGYTVTRKDTCGNAITSGTTTVYLYSSSVSGSKKFYDAASGGSIITSINITDGNSTADFWYYDETPGTYTITTSDNATSPDGVTGIDDATDSVIVSAGATAQFTLNDPGDTTVGTRLGYTVTRKDQFGNLTTSGATTVYLYSSSVSSSKKFYNASSGGSIITSINITGGNSTADFWYYDEAPGTYTITVSDNSSAPDGTVGIDDAADSVTISAGPLSQFSLSDPGNTTAGTRLGYTVTRQDGFGNAITSGTTTVYLYSSSASSSKKFYDAASGGNIITSIDITGGNSTADFWYYDETPGTYTITTSDNATSPDGTTGIDDATDSVTISAAAVFEFTLTDPGDMTVGTRLGYTVTRKDQFGNVNTSGTTTVYLYSSSAGANKRFYDAASGGNIITSIDITNGNSTADFWYYDETPGTYTITASDNATSPDGTTGIDDATDSVVVSAGATSQFTLNDPGDTTAGTRLGYTVTRKDQFGNLTTSGTSAVYLYTTSGGANAKFYDAASGGNVITSINITGGNSTADFWYYDELAGTFTITASDNAISPDGTTGIDDATDSVVVSAGATSQFTLNNPGDMTVGTRLGYTATRKDAYSNVVTAGTTTVYLYTTSSGPQAKFYDAASGGNIITSINITGGNSTADFWYYDETPGTYTITASDNSTAPDGASGIIDATDSVTVSAAGVYEFTLNDPGDTTAGTRLGYTVTRKDQFGNSVTTGSTTVYLYTTSAGASARFYNASSGGSIITSISITDGNSTANFWYYDETPGTYTITASDNATSPDGNAGIHDATDSVTISPDAVSQFTLNDPGDVVIGNRLGYTVTRKDQFGNLVTTGTNTVYLYSSSVSSSKKFYDAASGGNIITSINITDGNSTANFWYYDETPGTYTITASDNATSPDGTTGIDDATDSVVVTATPASKFTLNDPGDIVAGDRAGYTVTRKDEFDNAVTSGTTTVYLYSSSVSSSKKFYDAASGGNIITSINITNGNSTANFWYYDETPGTYTITTSDNATSPDGVTGIDDATDSVVVSVGPLYKFTLNDPGSISTGSRAGYVVTRKDQFDNLITLGSTSVYLYTTSSGPEAKFYDAASGGTVITSIDITDGNSTADFWYYDETPGTYTITASDNATSPDGNTGVNDATDSITVSATATKFVIEDPTDGTVDNPITVTVRAEDNFGNVDTNYETNVTLVADGSATGDGLVDITSGVGTKNVSDTVAETVNLSLSDTEFTGLNVSSTQNVVFAAGAVAQFSLNNPGDMTAGTRLGYTVTRQDQFGNAITAGSATVYLYTNSAGANAKFYDAASGGAEVTLINITNGNSTGDFWYYDELAGTADITVSDSSSAPDGNTGINDATDSVAISAAATGKFLLNDPGNMTANTRLGYTITRKDSFDNLVTSGSDTAYLYTNSSGPASFYDAATDGNTITSVVISGGSSTANFWYYDEAAGTWTVTASDNAIAPDGNTGIDDGTDSVTVSAAPIVATKFVILNPTDGTVDNPITVTVRAEDNSGSVETTYQSDVTLNVSGSATGGGLVSIVNGIGTINISDSLAETVDLSLSDTEFTGLNVSSTQNVVFAAGAAAKFSINDPGDFAAGVRAAYVVTRKDQYNNIVTLGTTTVYVYTSSTSGAFFDAASGGSQITSIDITSGNSTAAFWYRDEIPGIYTITVSDNATAPDGVVGMDDDVDSIVISAGPVSQFTINNPGDMTEATRLEYTVTRKDQFNNLVTTGSNTVYLYSTSTGPYDFYDASTGGNIITSVVISGGSSTANFWYYDEAVGTWTVTVSDNASAPDGNTGINDSSDSVVVTSIPIVATRFVIIDPNDSVVGTPATVTVKAEDNFGSVETTYQNDVTLNVSGSATGGGLVDIVNGVGTLSISDTVAETVSLSLSDTQSTGLDVSSTQSLVFSPLGTIIVRPVPPGSAPSPSPKLGGAISFSGRAFPSAKVTIVTQLEGQPIPLKQETVASDTGEFRIQFSGLPAFTGSRLFYLSVTDKQAHVSLSNVFDVAQQSSNITDIFLAPTIDFLASVKQGEALSVAGYAVPNGVIEIEVDGNVLEGQPRAGQDGFYTGSVNTAGLDLGNHVIRVRQTDVTGQQSVFSLRKSFAVATLSTSEIQTDFNNDSIVNINDWSIFLSRWASPDPSTRNLDDLNGDGVVDVSDFSIFIRTISK